MLNPRKISSIGAIASIAPMASNTNPASPLALDPGVIVLVELEPGETNGNN